MPIRPPTAAASALILAGCVAAALLGGAATGRTAAKAPPPAESLGSAGQVALAICREHAAMIHDVRWAAACISHAQTHEARHAECVRRRGAQAVAECNLLVGQADDSADCMLPDDSAARLNKVLATAENRCVEQAMAEDGAVRTARLSSLRH